MDITQTTAGKGQGTFTYSDSSSSISFTATKITALSFNGNTANFTAKGTMNTTSSRTQAGSQIIATVSVIDNGPSGSTDHFSITISSAEYQASGTLISGNITVE